MRTTPGQAEAGSLGKTQTESSTWAKCALPDLDRFEIIIEPSEDVAKIADDDKNKRYGEAGMSTDDKSPKKAEECWDRIKK